MTFNKFTLLAAAAAGAFGASAQAQQAFPAATINGAGATLPANVTRQYLDCYGIQVPLANQGATSPLVNIADFNYATPALATLGNRFNCAGNAATAPIPTGPAGSPQFTNPRIIQPNITANYLATGSGAGINSWRFHSAPQSFPGSTVVLPAGWASYGNNAVQFAISETPLTWANVYDLVNGYNNLNLAAATDPSGGAVPIGTALSRYGAAIQIPAYIAPVAISYSPVYAKVRNGDGTLSSYRFTVTGARADGSGGLKLTRAQYCGIFNGLITNWNQLPTNVVNRDPADPNAFNVPLQIVGRSDSSGTTSLWTRALAAQCDGVVVNTGVNGTLPAITITTFGGASSATQRPSFYQNSAGTLPAAIRVGGGVFNKGTSPSFGGTVTLGNYVVADGNDGVAQAVDYLLDPSATPGDRTVNGKMGYNGTDSVLPATLFTLANTYGLNTASLQQNGIGTTYQAPTAAAATTAFSTVQPPESAPSGGAYCVPGGSVTCVTNLVATGTVPTGDRANPVYWVAPGNRFLINANTGATSAIPNPIAAPTKGYPIVGTSNVLLYTCYFTPALRTAINGVWATFNGSTTKDYNNQTFPAALTNNTTQGIIIKNGLAGMPTPWKNAIRETFFRQSTQASNGNVLGARNLWIQSRIPSVPSTASTTNNSLANTVSNPTCVGKVGA